MPKPKAEEKGAGQKMLRCAMSTAYPDTWRKPPQMIQSRGWRIALALGAVIYLALAIGTIEVNWTRVIAGMDARTAVCGWGFCSLISPPAGAIFPTG
jgi:hypothetical protein